MARRLAYLTSRYPALSATFITAEVEGLRRRGFVVRVFAVRRAPPPLPPELAAAAGEVTPLLPAGPAALAADLAWAVRTLPGRWPAVLRRVLRPGPVRPRTRLRLPAYLLEAVRLARRLRRWGAQHLHVHHANPAALVGALAAELTRLPRSVTVHGSDVLLEAEALALKLAGARFVVTVCRTTAAALRCRLGPLLPPLHVIPTGVDTRRFSPPSGRTPVRRCPRILALGRLHPVKDFPLLLRAAARLRAAGVPFRLFLGGEGPEGERLAREARTLGLRGRVRLLGGVAPALTPALYRRVDLFVLSSRSEGLPVVLLEAMATGLPVVATRVGGVPECVGDGETGLLVPPGDPEALAGALRRLLVDPERRARLGRAARERVLARYDREVHLNRLAQVFRGEGVGAPVGA